MLKLTDTQRAYLAEHLDELWGAFYDGDPDLLTSTCGCCQDKREFVKKVLAAGQT